MQNKKIAFVGSVSSGKTTLIRNLSNIEVMDTDVQSSIDIGKEMTTVGIDFGVIVTDNDLKISLYGVPGQRKFSFMWDFVKEGLWAVVILVKNNCNESIREINYLLDYFEVTDDVPCFICITHSDLIKGDTTSKRISEILNARNLKLPVYSIDATLKVNAELIFRTLIAMEDAKYG